MGLSEEWKTGLLILHEGFRLDPYTDTLGYLTGGVGHKMSQDDIDEFNHEWSDEQKQVYWRRKFLEDYSHASSHAQNYMDKYSIPYNDIVHFVIASMMFQLGPTGGHFPKMFKALSEGNTEEAVRQMKTNGKGKPSRWYIQTPNRVDALAKLLESN